MKIIQIAVSAAPAVQGQHNLWETLYALTDDGHIYFRDTPTAEGVQKTTWQSLDLPPQPR